MSSEMQIGGMVGTDLLSPSDYLEKEVFNVLSDALSAFCATSTRPKNGTLSESDVTKELVS